RSSEHEGRYDHYHNRRAAQSRAAAPTPALPRMRGTRAAGGRGRDMELIAQLLVNGVINGSHYALLGLGFGLIFGPTRITHFAFGPLYALAAYACWTAAAPLGLPLPVAIAVGILVGALSGVLTYRILYRPFERRQS